MVVVVCVWGGGGGAFPVLGSCTARALKARRCMGCAGGTAAPAQRLPPPSQIQQHSTHTTGGVFCAHPAPRPHRAPSTLRRRPGQQAAQALGERRRRCRAGGWQDVEQQVRRLVRAHAWTVAARPVPDTQF